MKKVGLFISFIILATLIAGFMFFNRSDFQMQQNQENNKIPSVNEESNPQKENSKPFWFTAELKDISTQEQFTVSQFLGKPILLESFAVWCPKCLSQQKEIKKLHEELGDSVVSISLDTDENEDEARVKSHIETNDFNWYYAVSPLEVTQSLIEEFGLGIVNAPSVPVILICPDGEYRKLDSGVKSTDELKKEISTCN